MGERDSIHDVLDASPSRVVTVGIVMLLAGIGLMEATQDAVMGFPAQSAAVA